MAQTVNIDKEIEQIGLMLRRETERKLELIVYYLMNNSNIDQINITSKDDLITFLKDPMTPIEIIEGIYDLLDQTFSRGYPNFIYEFSLKENKSKSDLINIFETALPENESVAPFENTHTYIKRMGPVTETSSKISVKVEYEKYKEERGFGGVSERGALELKSTFDIVFDFEAMLCLIKCGDRRQLNTIEYFISTKVIGVFSQFGGFSLATKLLGTTIENEYRLDKQTIILLDFLEEEFNKHDYRITDYFTIAFSNKQSDKVK